LAVCSTTGGHIRDEDAVIVGSVRVAAGVYAAHDMETEGWVFHHGDSDQFGRGVRFAPISRQLTRQTVKPQK